MQRQRQEAQSRQQEFEFLKKMKKPNLPFEIDLEVAKNNEIKKIKKSNELPE
jgi:hypothetical protein